MVELFTSYSQQIIRVNTLVEQKMGILERASNLVAFCWSKNELRNLRQIEWALS